MDPMGKGNASFFHFTCFQGFTHFFLFLRISTIANSLILGGFFLRLCLAHSIQGTGIFLPTFTIKRSTKCRQNIPYMDGMGVMSIHEQWLKIFPTKLVRTNGRNKVGGGSHHPVFLEGGPTTPGILVSLEFHGLDFWKSRSQSRKISRNCHS